MSISLLIQNGDLALNGTSLATVSGPQKLTQDLGCGILTPMGTDESNPTFGSLLDGGISANGQFVESIIGESNWNRIALTVRSEIQRICADYQRQQISRNQADATTYGKSTLLPGEILVSVQRVELLQAEDNLLAKIILTTGTGPIQVNIPVASGTVIST